MPTKDKGKNNKHQRAWYSRNRKKKIAEVSANRDKLKQVIRKIKEETPCTDCNMDFDHVNGDKVDNVGTLKGCNVYAALREIEKCEVVCANCHRIRTHAALLQLRQREHV